MQDISRYRKGVCKPTSPYIYMDNTWLQRFVTKQTSMHFPEAQIQSSKDILFQEQEKEAPLAFLAGTVPTDLRNKLFSALRGAMMPSHGDVLVSTRSGSSGETPCEFGALHFSYYARNATKV